MILLKISDTFDGAGPLISAFLSPHVKSLIRIWPAWVLVIGSPLMHPAAAFPKKHASSPERTQGSGTLVTESL